MRRTVSLMAGLVVGTGCTTAEWGEWVPFDPAAPELAGVWESPSTGHLVSFSPEGRSVFHVLGPLCVQDNGVVPEYSLYRVGEGGDIGLHYFDYRAYPTLLQDSRILTPRDGLPENCLTSDDRVAPADLVRHVTTAFDSLYAFFDERDVDWERQKRLLFSDVERIETDSTAFAALREALAPLNDGHVNLTWGDQTFSPGSPRLRQRLATLWRADPDTISEGAFVSQWHRGILGSAYTVLDEDVRQGANGALEWGTIDDSVGYLRVNRFTSFTSQPVGRPEQYDSLHAAMIRVRQDLQDAQSLIVDVALNGGGSDAAALMITSFFADSVREALSYEARGADRQVLEVSPVGEGESRPIYLVTSEVTASAAESFVLMMRSLPHVTHVGERTRGILSSLLPKPFPNGFLVTFSYQTVRDSRGNVFEGVGIPPECEIPLFPDADIHGEFARVLRTLAVSSSEACGGAGAEGGVGADSR